MTLAGARDPGAKFDASGWIALAAMTAVACAHRAYSPPSPHPSSNELSSSNSSDSVERAKGPGDGSASDAPHFGTDGDGRERLEPPVVSGMREIASGAMAFEKTGERVVVEKAERSSCFRVAYASSVPLRSSLDDESTTLAETPKPLMQTTLGAHGPVCIQKGGALRVRFAAPSHATVRYRFYSAP